MRVLVSTYPFGISCPEAVSIIKKMGWELKLNPYKRKITRAELKELLEGVDALIAGTEGIDEDTLTAANTLRLISRVGIGLDGLDWKAIKKRDIEVSYTPGASTTSVAELAVGFMLDVMRNISGTNVLMHYKVWQRYIGSELNNKIVGVIGLGRIGKAVSRLLAPFNCKILVNDINPDYQFIKQNNLQLKEKNDIYKEADIITLHIPLTKLTRNLINIDVLSSMKKTSFLINTSRGPIVNDNDLYRSLKENMIKGAALDVYNEEPYSGPLLDLDNVVLTAHMGSCSEESRKAMEMGAAQAVVDFFTDKTLKNRVPDELREE